jgi:hypothetical protein
MKAPTDCKSHTETAPPITPISRRGRTALTANAAIGAAAAGD